MNKGKGFVGKGKGYGKDGMVRMAMARKAMTSKDGKTSAPEGPTRVGAEEG